RARRASPAEVRLMSAAAESRSAPVDRWLRLPSPRAVLLTAVAVAAVFVIVFPFLWIALSSFRDPDHFLTLHLRDAVPHSFGLISVPASVTIPISTWVLSDFYRSLPADLEEAGYVDGASLVRVLRHIVLPLSIPGLLAAGAYAFILSWNDFLFALVIMNSNSHFTAPVGIHAYFTGQNVTQEVWAELMAASTLVTLPSVVLFGFFQRYMV